jgi:restriction system protein
LLESTGRGRFRITPLGLEVLHARPERIDIAFLERFPGFKEFKTYKGPELSDTSTQEVTETPEESLETAYQDLRRSLAEDILERVKRCSPQFFEKLVVDLLVAMGYGGSRKDAGKAVGKSGDGGVDGIIKEDRLGLDAVYIQAKRWEAAVGRPVVQGFAGSLEGYRARKGVLISTSTFTAEAQDYINRIEKKIVLIDGEQLAQFMIDHNVGVMEVATYRVKKANADYFDEE